MARKVRNTFLFILTSLFFLASLYHLYHRDSISISLLSSAIYDNFSVATNPPPPKITISISDNHAINNNIPPSPVTPFQISTLPDKVSSEKDDDHAFNNKIYSPVTPKISSRKDDNHAFNNKISSPDVTPEISSRKDDNHASNDNITSPVMPVLPDKISSRKGDDHHIAVNGNISDNHAINVNVSDHNHAIHNNISSPVTPFQISALPHTADDHAFNNKIPSPVTPLTDEISSASILMPDWEVFVIVSPDYTPQGRSYVCVFGTGETTPARITGVLRFPVRFLFKCEFPKRARLKFPYKQPTLAKSPEIKPPSMAAPNLLKWSFLVYDSLTTEDDVVLFVKGLNHRQGINREPNEFRCVFGYEGNMVIRTNVTSSIQEVFRCNGPDPTVFKGETISVSIEVVYPVPMIVPSVAYYSNTPRKLEQNKKSKRARLCACTMVYNVGKFLKEWVLYHSKIGVEKFVLYDNASDDDLGKVVNELVQDGYDVKTYFWLWPKTQEAGFSHSAIYAKDACSWMMYIDVDEFVYSPLWSNVSRPSMSLLHSLLPNPMNVVQDQTLDKRQVGEISIPCYEFGPSNKSSHPISGVTQGYNCRRKVENRHKSTVFLDVVDHSLLNVIHHFTLRKGYRGKKVSSHDMVVNHYKFQAWPEFKAKFRRRVSAYVYDWTKQVNPRSNDRTPGLGYSPVEPKGWPLKFCEVYDNGLRNLTWRWFALKSPTPPHYRMAWQR